jgi:hypothetical protein
MISDNRRWAEVRIQDAISMYPDTQARDVLATSPI